MNVLLLISVNVYFFRSFQNEHGKCFKRWEREKTFFCGVIAFLEPKIFLPEITMDSRLLRHGTSLMSYFFQKIMKLYKSFCTATFWSEVNSFKFLAISWPI